MGILLPANSPWTFDPHIPGNCQQEMRTGPHIQAGSVDPSGIPGGKVFEENLQNPCPRLAKRILTYKANVSLPPRNSRPTASTSLPGAATPIPETPGFCDSRGGRWCRLAKGEKPGRSTLELTEKVMRGIFQQAKPPRT